MKLQIAVDLADFERVLRIADEIYDVIDIFEVGTPVIMKEGLRPVKALKMKYPNLCILADTKIIDGGAIECEDSCAAGADIVTVLALADDATISEVVNVAHQYGRKVLADLICVQDIVRRSKELLAFGVDYVGVHTGVDMQKEGRTPLKDLKTLIRSINAEKTAIAGGVNLDSIDDYVRYNPEIIIAGGALYNTARIRDAVIEMKGHLVHGNKE